jgi:hypothetical protein
MKPTTKAATLLLTSVLSTAALLLLGGCSTREMKGSPFYTGEYAVNVPGAEMRRVNLWPLAYYREPALSLAWPVFEHTEEHLALRPLFSAYGDTQAYWEYNLLWPLCQADTKGRDYRIFPYFWGTGKRAGGIEQDYHVLFPFVWHFEDEARALFPLWISSRSGWKDGLYTERDTWLGWPLAHYHTGVREESWHVTLFGRCRYPNTGETYTGFPWPLFFSWRDKEKHGLFTPLYAYETSDAQNVNDGWAALPLLLAWHRWEKSDNDLNVLLGLYNQHWSDSNRSGYLFPLCAYDSKDRLLLTPLFGWDKPDAKEPAGYWYPLTPLTGIRTGSERGGWLFPLFDHTSSVSNETYSTRYLLLGYAKHERFSWRNRVSSSTGYGFFPLFNHSFNTFTNRVENDDSSTEGFTHNDRRLLLNYSEEGQTVCRAPTGDAPQVGTNRVDKYRLEAWKSKKALGDYRKTTVSDGLFPLWSSGATVDTRLDGTRLREQEDSSLLLALYDTKREVESGAGTTAKPLDYTRRRILWRVWHYEKRNGDVSVDIFPAITYDTHTDGFSKTSFLWRLFRYEKRPDGGVDFDLLFLPLKRAR